ncbi:MAG: NAD(P)H-dependent oxidoreductase [Candidatus Heimdallarchaeaceae archaeon]|jgi:multimeric flavodoxin WrbA
MSVVIFNGDLKNQKVLMPLQKILEEELSSIGLIPESFLLHQVEIKSCIGCFKCWDTSPGICTGVKGDKANEIAEKVIKSELLVFLTPLTFGGFSSEIKKMIERLLPLLQPGVNLINGESHHRKRYKRYPSLIAIASTDKDDEEENELFKLLIDRFSKNFYPPNHKSEVFKIGTDLDTMRERVKHFIEEMELRK